MVAAAGSLVLPVGPVSGAAGCSSGGTCVEVHQWIDGTDTTVRQLSAADIASEADVATGNGAICYHTRSVKDGPENSCHNVTRALSIHTLLADTPDQNSPGQTLGDDATFTQTVRPGAGSRSTLTHDELAGSAQSPFENSLLPVVRTVVDGGGPVEYVRPLLNDDDQDVNANDIFSTANADDALTIYVFTGQMLTVKVTANHPHVKSGKPVTFTGTATGNAGTVPPGSLNYSWVFGDGATATTTTDQVSHTYPAGSGTYSVQLTATGNNDGSGGTSKPLTVTVGDPGTHTPPPTQSPKPGPVTTKTPTPSPSPGPVTTKTPQPGADPTPSPGAGSKPPKIPGFGKLPGSLAARLQRMLSGQPPQVANGTAGLPTVSGQLVGAGTPLSVSQAASAASTLGSVPAADETTGWSPGVVPIYVAVVLLLLGVGIGREHGWRRPRRR